MSNIIIDELPYVSSVKKMFNITLGKKEYKQYINLYLIDENFRDHDNCLNYILAAPKIIKNIIFWLIPIYPPLLIFVLFFSPQYQKDDVKKKLPILNNFFGAQALSKDSLPIALENIKRIINAIGGEYNEEHISSYFHYVYHFVLERSNAHYYKINNYVALYGFMRNMLMSSIVLFYYSFLILSKNTNTFLPAIIFWVVNIIFLYGYIKFSRRYTEEIIFAASCLTPLSSQEPSEIKR
ncbi:MAG: hypothetical protein ACHQJ6_08185 [Candidatus Berkiellales bacterium]